jgi:hypothetical protein
LQSSDPEWKHLINDSQSDCFQCVEFVIKLGRCFIASSIRVRRACKRKNDRFTFDRRALSQSHVRMLKPTLPLEVGTVASTFLPTSRQRTIALHLSRQSLTLSNSTIWMASTSSMYHRYNMNMSDLVFLTLAGSIRTNEATPLILSMLMTLRTFSPSSKIFAQTLRELISPSRQRCT